MKTTYGAMPEEMPAGFFKAVSFPVLAMLDKETGDGRILDSAGASTRNLPLSIRGQFTDNGGHDGAVITGALFEVTVDPKNGVLSGRGFLLNDEFGRRHARYIRTGAMSGNSVDLADVSARFEEDVDTGDYRVRFTKFNLAATTGVSKPAFSEAYAEIDDMSEEEMVASFGDPMEELVASFDTFTIALADDQIKPQGMDIDITASLGAMQEHAAFYIPETDKPQKIVVDADGRVYGHLGLWESCHDGIVGRCTRIPRPNDRYASFNKPGVLTEKGIVETGPIFAYGGHRPANGAESLEDAYGSIENAWADVRITEGRFGPWLSGVVRPGVNDDTVYAARASRISGHWVGGKLKAIVSVNAEGFDVPGSGFAAAPFAFTTSDDGIGELVASFPTCTDFADNVDLTPPLGAQREAAKGLKWVADGHAGDGLEDATVTRARSMANGEARSPETVRRMRDFFNRHQSDKKATGWRPGETGYPSPGRVAWALWGGDTGWSWAKKTSDRLDSNAAKTENFEVTIHINEGETETESEMNGDCPDATHDIKVNLANRETAITDAAYGPLNPDEPNTDFWQAKADRWSVTIADAKGSLCGNCAAFIQTTEMKTCIENGLGEEGDDVANAANLGFCEIFDFKCAGTRTCDAWVVGGPITDANSEDAAEEPDAEASAKSTDSMLLALLVDE